MAKPITSFSGEYAFLSNFWTCIIPMDGLNYPSVEHAFQAAKSLDKNVRHSIQQSGKPGNAKRLGREIELREDWEQIKLQLMEDLVFLKFGDLRLRDRLDATGDVPLIEDNNWGDRYWGVCNGVGENHLGKILMNLREHFRGSLWRS